MFYIFIVLLTFYIIDLLWKGWRNSDLFTLKNKFSHKIIENLNDFSEIILLCFLGLTLAIQTIFKLPYILFSEHSLIEILGFVVGIFSLYGIYVAFLQFMTENDKDYFLGISRMEFMLEHSIWSQMTRTKLFYLLLVSVVGIPIISKINLIDTPEHLAYFWQSCYIVILILYLSLLKENISFVFSVFSINSQRVEKEISKSKGGKESKQENNRYGRDSKIIEYKQRLYHERFWRVYKNENEDVSDYVRVWLSYDFKRLDEIEIEEFVTVIFHRVYRGDYNLSESIDAKIKKIKNNEEAKNFFKFYKNFCQHKWEFLKKYQEHISASVWKELIEDDIRIFEKLVLEHGSKEVFEIEYPAKYNITRMSLQENTRIVEFLFDTLLGKEDIEFDKIIEDTKKSTDELGFHGENKFIIEILSEVENLIKSLNTPHTIDKYKSVISYLKNYQYKEIANLSDVLQKLKPENLGGTRTHSQTNPSKIEKALIEKLEKYQNSKGWKIQYRESVEKYKWKKIFEKYESLRQDDIGKVKLPNYEKLINQNQFDAQNQIRIDFENSALYSQVCFDYLDRGRIQDFSNNENIKNLISSMNEEYRLAFMLYQLFYTDHQQWDNNLTFYDEEIKKIMHYDQQYHDYLFNQAKEIILRETNIGHRITKEFLEKLWKTRKDKITTISWFKQFGRRHDQTNLKILYVQWLLSGKDGAYSSRFSLNRITFTRARTIKCSGRLRISMGKLDKIRWKKRNHRSIMSNLCRDYFLLSLKLPSIFTTSPYSYDGNDIYLSVSDLLFTGEVDLSEVLDNLPVKALLNLEWILRYRYYLYEREKNYTPRTFLNAITHGNDFIWFSRKGIVDFYVVKIADNFYKELFLDQKFIQELKSKVRSILISDNITLREYVERIAQEVSTDAPHQTEGLSKNEQGEMISFLTDILSRDDFQVKASPRKYRYKLIMMLS